MSSLYTKRKKRYDNLYDDYPDPLYQTKYLCEKYSISLNDLKKEINKIQRIGWKEMRFEFNEIPASTPRPRQSKGHFYVEGALEHKKFMKDKLDEYEVIHTATEFMVISFHPIPKSTMEPMEKVLAQLGYIRPMKDPDWDNVGKTYSDMTNNLLIMNDNCIVCGETLKFYSIKPRVVIYIRYQSGYDSNYNRLHTEKSKTFYLVNERKEINKNAE